MWQLHLNYEWNFKKNVEKTSVISAKPKTATTKPEFTFHLNFKATYCKTSLAVIGLWMLFLIRFWKVDNTIRCFCKFRCSKCWLSLICYDLEIRCNFNRGSQGVNLDANYCFAHLNIFILLVFFSPNQRPQRDCDFFLWRKQYCLFIKRLSQCYYQDISADILCICQFSITFEIFNNIFNYVIIKPTKEKIYNWISMAPQINHDKLKIIIN